MAKKGKKAAKVRKPRAAKPKPATNGIGHNSGSDDEARALFLSNVAKRKKLLEAKDAAVAALRNHAKTIKSDGFTVPQVDTAIRISTPEGEEALREKLANDIQAARWMGSAIGTQFEFELADRTPAVDRARDEGVQASMQNEPCKPPYDPSTPQYASWMDGYQDDQKRIMGGIQPLHDDGAEFEDADDGL